MRERGGGRVGDVWEKTSLEREGRTDRQRIMWKSRGNFVEEEITRNKPMVEGPLRTSESKEEIVPSTVRRRPVNVETQGPVWSPETYPCVSYDK